MSRVPKEGIWRGKKSVRLLDCGSKCWGLSNCSVLALEGHWDKEIVRPKRAPGFVRVWKTSSLNVDIMTWCITELWVSVREKKAVHVPDSLQFLTWNLPVLRVFNIHGNLDTGVKCKEEFNLTFHKKSFTQRCPKITEFMAIIPTVDPQQLVLRLSGNNNKTNTQNLHQDFRSHAPSWWDMWAKLIWFISKSKLGVHTWWNCGTHRSDRCYSVTVDRQMRAQGLI